MRYPLSTGHAARLLGTTEPKLAEAVRRGHVDPEPPVMAGRRLWSEEHIRRAAEVFGVPYDELAAVVSGTSDQGSTPESESIACAKDEVS